MEHLLDGQQQPIRVDHPAPSVDASNDLFLKKIVFEIEEKLLHRK